MTSRQRRPQRRKAAQPAVSTTPASGRKRKRQQPVQHTDSTSDEGSSLDGSTSPAPAAAVPAAAPADIALLNDQSLSAVNQLLSRRDKKPVAHRTVAQPQRHDEKKGDEEEEEEGAVWERDNTVAAVDAEQLQPIVAVADSEHHDMDDDMWQTDDTQHAAPPHPPDPHSHYPEDDDQHSHAHSTRTAAEEADAYRQQQLDAIAASPSPPASTQPSLAHRTEVAVDDDSSAADGEQGGAISIELPKDLVASSKDKKQRSKADKEAAAAAKEKKKQAAPRLTAEAKALQLKMQKLHLLSSITLLQRYSAIADNDELQGRLLSLLPARLMLSAGDSVGEEPMSPLSGASVASVEVTGGTNVAMASFGVDWVKQVTTWYHNLIFLAPSPPSSATASPASPSASPSSSSPSSASVSMSPLTSLCSLGHLPQFFTCLSTQLASALTVRRIHSAHTKLLLFLALLRSLQINARLVHAIDQTPYPWEQQGWMDELRRLAAGMRGSGRSGKQDVGGRVKEMRIGGRLVQVIDRRDNLRRLWRLALPRQVGGESGSGSACACGGSVEWRYAGLAGSVVPPVRSVSLIGRRVSINRLGDSGKDEVVVDDDDDEEKEAKEVSEKVKMTGRKANGKLSRERETEDQCEDEPLAARIVKAEKSITNVSAQRRKADGQPTAASKRRTSAAAVKAEATSKVEEEDNGQASSGKAKRKRKQRAVSSVDEEADEAAAEEADNEAAIYAASMRQRKAKAGKPVKDETGMRRSERVKQQADADVIVLSSDDDDDISRIKQQAEREERKALERLQREEDERIEDEAVEDREDAENMVRPTALQSEKDKVTKKAVKRRLMREENLVSSEDSDADVPIAPKRDNSSHGSHAKVQADKARDSRAPARLFTLEEEDEMDNIPLVAASINKSVPSVSAAVSAMMDEASHSHIATEHKHATISTHASDVSVPQRNSAKSSSSPVEKSDGTADIGPRQTSCYVCGSHRPTASNPILLCDSCERECHLKCTTPPLTRVPKGNWYCKHCTHSNSDKRKPHSELKQDKQRKDASEDEQEDEDFVPQKRTRGRASTGSKRRKGKEDVAADDESAKRSHLFDRYQFGNSAQNGKEEKEEAADGAVEEEKEAEADADSADGDNGSVMEDIIPKKQSKVNKKRQTKRKPSSSSPSPSSSSSAASRSRRSSATTSSSPTPSKSSPKNRSSTDATNAMYVPFWVELYCPSKECLTGDHMVLTRSGWRSLKTIRRDDIVASINVKSCAMEWKKVQATQRIAHKAGTKQLYRMQGEGMDLVATREHRMLTARSQNYRLQINNSLHYDTVGDLLDDFTSATNKRATGLTGTAFEYSSSRSVLHSGINRQPDWQLLIPGLQVACNWWWQKDRQKAFLRFYGFWLGNGDLCVDRELVQISPRKLEATAWLIDLLDEVFPRWWGRHATGIDEGGTIFCYTIRCTPLYVWLRAMAAGPVGYNPRDPTALRSYPHFTLDGDLAAHESETCFRLAGTAIDASTWTEAAMMAAFAKGSLRCHTHCILCDQPRRCMPTCSGEACRHVDHIARAHPACANATFDKPWHCPECSGEEVDSKRCWACKKAEREEGNEMLLCEAEGCQWGGHLDCIGLTAAPAAKAAWYCHKHSAAEETTEMGSHTYNNAMSVDVEVSRELEGQEDLGSLPLEFEDAEAAAAALAVGAITWNGGLSHTNLCGHWFSLKRWMGHNVAGTFANLSQPQAIALLEGFCRAEDEYAQVQYKKTGEAAGVWSCSNSSFPLIDHLQLIGQLAGARVDLERVAKAGMVTVIKGREVELPTDHWRLTFNFIQQSGVPVSMSPLAKPLDVSTSVDERGYYEYEDDGYVYDITVADNHNFLTQRLSMKTHRGDSGNKAGVAGDDVRAQPLFVGNCWIHVDPINNLVDAPHTYESLKPRRLFSYVLAAYPPVGAVLQRAVSSGGFGFASASAMALPYMDELSRVVLDDVTARYGVGSAMLPRGRLDEQWWQSTLELLSAPRTSAHDRRIHEAEQASFQSSRSTSLAELPTTLAALKKHPLYISLDQVKKFEMLRPGAPIAARTTVGRQHVSLYWRKDVHLLHTQERWVREKRQVREDELTKPAKLVKSQTMAGRKKRKIMEYTRAMQGDFDRLSLDAAVQDLASASASSSSTTLPADDELSALYGVWQTDPWTPPAATNGLVPRNARGQVDLWTPAHLPTGCTHLPYPRIAAIARKLQVDHAEAMVGFEVRGGRSIPRFEGIVVLTGTAEWVLEAYWEREREVKEREAKKRWERVGFNWRRLVKGAVVRAKLMAELKERTENGEGTEEAHKAGSKSSRKGKAGRRGKKAQDGKEVDEQEEGDESGDAEEGQTERTKSGKKKRAVPRGAVDAEVLNDLNHVHDFTSSKTMNQETGTWIATCRCGARNEFEDL